MWSPNRRIRKGRSLGSFLFCFLSLPLQLSYIFSCLSVLYNDMLLRAQNPVCSSCRNLEGICESAIQALLTLGTRLKCNKDHYWVHHSGGKMREREGNFQLFSWFPAFFFLLQLFRYTSFIHHKKSHWGPVLTKTKTVCCRYSYLLLNPTVQKTYCGINIALVSY